MLAVEFWMKDKGYLSWNELGVDSSTLFGAFSNILLLMYGDHELQRLFRAYRDGRLVFSSLFPVVKGTKEDIFFFPKPILNPSVEIGGSSFVEKDDGYGRYSIRKRIKRVKWISMRLFGEFMNSIELSGGDYRAGFDMGREDVRLHGEFAFFEGELDEDVLGGYTNVEIPHVSKDRLNASPEGNLFYASELRVSDGVGFYLLVDGCESWDYEKLKAVFRLLADEGIGGNRSVGRGQFDIVEFKEMNALLTDEGKGFVNLSLVYPLEDEIASIYTLSLKRKDGFVFKGKGVPLKKSVLRMLSEGCFFTNRVKGKVLEEEVGGTKIFRNGKAFVVSGVRMQ